MCCRLLIDSNPNYLSIQEERNDEQRSTGKVSPRRCGPRAGPFTPDEMARLEEFWQFCLDHPGPSASRIYADKNEFVPGQGLDAARALPDRETGFAYQDVGNPANRLRFGELIHLPGIQSIVAAAFGARRAWGLAEQIFLKEPDSPRTTWHQDISDLRVEGMDGLTMWLCLDPVSAEESLELVRGVASWTGLRLLQRK